MRLLLIVLCIGLLAGVSRSEMQSAVVDRVIDGDTLVLESGQRVRLLQVDAPERGECGYEEATQTLRELEGREVGLEQDENFDDEDKYGRLLRYVHHDGQVVNVQLHRRGLVDSYFYQGKHGKYQYKMDGPGSCASPRQGERT